MKNSSAWEMAKHSERANGISEILETPIVKYGRIIKVIDVETVIAESVVRTSLAREVYTVTLLNFSSALFEASVDPRVGDAVLLLFLQYHDPRMFHEEFVENDNATGYNCFSGVGILMSTVKGLADTVIRFQKDGELSAVNILTSSRFSATANSAFSLMFCRAVVDSDDEALISVVFGDGRPFQATFLPSAPIALDMQSSQDIKIGFDWENNDTHAPMSVVLGGDAEINVDSASGKTESYEKPVSLEAKSLSFKSEQKITIEGSNESLGAVLSDFIQAMLEFDSTNAVVGSPVAAGPMTVPKLQVLKTRLENVLNK